jgi:hypothetical protein
VKQVMKDLADPDPRHALGRMFDSIVRRNSDPRRPHGCLITNTALECPAIGNAVSYRLTEGISQQELAICRGLRRVQADGSLVPTADARVLVRVFSLSPKG